MYVKIAALAVVRPSMALVRNERTQHPVIVGLVGRDDEGNACARTKSVARIHSTDPPIYELQSGRSGGLLAALAWLDAGVAPLHSTSPPMRTRITHDAMR